MIVDKYNQIEGGVGTGAALFVWGLHPHVRWIPGTCKPCGASPGMVVVDAAPGPDSGISIGLANVGERRTVYDPDSG